MSRWEPNKAICVGKECPLDATNYCSRCVLVLKRKACPGMSEAKILTHFDALSRQRALSEGESVMLESAMRNVDREESRLARRALRGLAA